MKNFPPYTNSCGCECFRVWQRDKFHEMFENEFASRIDSDLLLIRVIQCIAVGRCVGYMCGGFIAGHSQRPSPVSVDVRQHLLAPSNCWHHLTSEWLVLPYCNWLVVDCRKSIIRQARFRWVSRPVFYCMLLSEYFSWRSILKAFMWLVLNKLVIRAAG